MAVSKTTETRYDGGRVYKDYTSNPIPISFFSMSTVYT